MQGSEEAVTSFISDLAASTMLHSILVDHKSITAAACADVRECTHLSLCALAVEFLELPLRTDESSPEHACMPLIQISICTGVLTSGNTDLLGMQDTW